MARFYTDMLGIEAYKEDKPGVVAALKALVDKGEYKEGLY